MRAVDAAVLTALADTDLPVHDGDVPTDPADPKVVTADLPYLVLWGSPVGDDDAPRYDGRPSRRHVGFQVTFVGESREQAKAAGERARTALSNRHLTVAGAKTWKVRVVESVRVDKDPDVHTPDGRALWFGADQYQASLTL